MKNCLICNKEFISYKNHQKYCSKECAKKFIEQYIKKYYQIHKQIPKLKNCIICGKQFYKNKNQICCSEKCSQKLRKEYLKQYRKNYYKIHKVELNKKKSIWNKQYREQNKDKILLYMKDYYFKNKEKLDKYKTDYHRNRRRNDINYRLKQNLRKRIWDVLKNNIKSEATMKLIGCSIDQLKQHLELKFKKGMKWLNYGKQGWEIDHIKPCSSFDLSKPEEQKICFHYTNLQPLWAEENSSKRDNIIEAITV